MAEWYDAQNMGSAFPLLDYGTQTIARNVNNALPNNQNNSGLQWWMNADRSRYPSPMMPGMLDQTGQMGASNYRAPQLNTLDPNWQNELAGYGSTMDRGNINNTFLSNLKQKAKGFTTPIMGLVKGGLEGIKNQFEYKPATEEAWDPNTGQFVSAEEQDKMNALGGYYSDAARNQRRQRARVVNMIKRREAGQEYGEDNLRRLQELGYGPKETITTTVGDNINQGGGGGSEAAFTQTSPGGISQEVSRAARGDPTGTGGGWRLAQGGRIGYQGGEFVDEDINIEGPGFDVNENLMASDPGAMDSLNEMSMQIFGKGVHELSEEEYQMLIDMTNEQASAGQDQGLASLV